jgi:ribosomal protein S18 acetylase RimI-like enzyme
MELKLIFRAATAHDAESIAELHAKVYGQPPCIKSLRKAWEKDTDGKGGRSVHVCVDQATSQIIGAIFSRPKAPDKKNRFLPNTQQQEREIVDHFVHPDFQHDRRKAENPKIGLRLLTQNLKISDKVNATTILSVSKTNAAAIHLYDALGFKTAPQKNKNNSKPTKLVMVRPQISPAPV